MEKKKRAPITPHDPKLYLTLIIADLLILLFFHLADLIGAVGLHIYYFWGSLLAVLVINCVMWVLLASLTTSPVRRFALVVLCFVTFPALVVLGWMWLLGFAVIITILIVLVGLVLSWRYAVLLRLTLALLFCTACYLGAFGFYDLWSVQANRSIFTTVEDHQYLLVVAYSGFGDPAPLVLYECNRLAFDCHEVYHTESRYYWNLGDNPYLVDLASNPATQTLDILLDGEVVHQYPLLD